ncbi:MAG: hypothetical protein Q4G35_12295 [Propionibacteriaceae bacterium]|nr:hypothetical protein [Propionibacteriaceae bacterium]
MSDSPADRLDDLTDVPFDPADAAPQPHANGFGAKACFDASGKALEPDGTKSDITNGASRIWLCGDAGQQFDAVGPNEPLITNLDTLTQYLIEQPEVSGDIYEPGTLFTLVIEYPDGTKHVASALNQPGGGIYFGDGVAYGSGDQLFDLAHSLWQIQRKAIEERDAAPADPAALASCPTHQYALFEVGTADVVAGFLCTEADLHKGERVSLTPAAAKVIAGELESNSVAGYGEWPTDTFMVLTNAWGDTMRLRQERDNTWVWVGNGHGTPMVWTPSAEAQAAIDAAN